MFVVGGVVVVSWCLFLFVVASCFGVVYCCVLLLVVLCWWLLCSVRWRCCGVVLWANIVVVVV